MKASEVSLLRSNGFM